MGRAAAAVGVLAALACLAVAVMSAAIGLAYNPDARARIVLTFLVSVGVLAVAIWLCLWHPRQRWVVTHDIASVVLGFPLIFWGGYLVLRDPGDFLMWIWIAVLGASLCGLPLRAARV